jgi:hypothetical protein
MIELDVLVQRTRFGLAGRMGRAFQSAVRGAELRFIFSSSTALRGLGKREIQWEAAITRLDT